VGHELKENWKFESWWDPLAAKAELKLVSGVSG
jgi:hypothetical protein